jgi:hypothetical protein
MKPKLWLVAVVLLNYVTISQAADGQFPDSDDDALKYLMSKSSLVVVGELLTDRRELIFDLGRGHGTMPVKIIGVLAGSLPGVKEIKVQFGSPVLIREGLHTTEAEPEIFRKGAKCILFLKPSRGGDVHWQEADIWFGCQRYSPLMADSLRRLWWEKQTATVRVGMTRAQVELTLLPPLYMSGGGMMYGGGQNAIYWVDKYWKVSLWYDYSGIYATAIAGKRGDNPSNWITPGNRVINRPVLKREDLKPEAMEMTTAIIDEIRSSPIK